MKKYVILTSMLALAACHSGGGSHHGAPVSGPVEPAIDMPVAVQKWNQTGANVNAVADRGTPGDIFTFNVDNEGNITSVALEGRTYTRTGNENKYVSAVNGETRTIELATLGKEAGLTFADFGYAQETEQTLNKTERDVYVFTGGSNLIKNADVKDATFNGTAVAYIEADMPGGIVNQVSRTDKATLVVDASGNHMLTMPFSQADNPWYDVAYNNGLTFELSNGDNVAPDFRVEGMTQKEMYVNKQFYGDAAGTASEVTYRVGAEYEDNATGREVEFDAAFGGKRQ